MALSLQKVTAWTNSFVDFLKTPPRIFRLQSRKFYHVDFFVTSISVKITSVINPADWDVNCVYVTSTDSSPNSRWTVIPINMTTTLDCDSNQVAHVLCDAIVLKKAQVRFEVDIRFMSTLDEYNIDRWDDETKTGLKKAKVQFENSSFNSSLFECTGDRLRYIYDFSKERRISIWDADEIKFNKT